MKMVVAAKPQTMQAPFNVRFFIRDYEVPMLPNPTRANHCLPGISKLIS